MEIQDRQTLQSYKVEEKNCFSYMQPSLFLWVGGGGKKKNTQMCIFFCVLKKGERYKGQKIHYSHKKINVSKSIEDLK